MPAVDPVTPAVEGAALGGGEGVVIAHLVRVRVRARARVSHPPPG